MFEPTLDADPAGGPSHADAALSPARVAEMTDTVAHALSSPSGLDDEQRLAAIRALEVLGSVTTAAQAKLSAEFSASQEEAAAERGVPQARRGRGVAHQVAIARRESPHRGQQHLGLAKIVECELPHTWQAWRTGRITEWTATVIARETACLDLETRLDVDRLVAGDPERLEEMGTREVAGTCASHAARLDPASVTARRRRAESERTVTLRPAPDTMTLLTALLPVSEGVGAYAALTMVADSARAAGDPRSRGQVMADTLVDRVTTVPAAAETAVEAAANEHADDSVPPRRSSPAGLALGLVMTDAALFGLRDDPAHIDGYGPIPAELAREIVAGACSREESVWLRRLFARPDTGELAAMDARSRLFRGTLARFIRLRDKTCRTPWCDAPVRHIDHAVDHALGGDTSGANGQGLCEACNHAKQAGGWRAWAAPDGSITTTLPTGWSYTTRPPPLVCMHDRDLPPITIDYVLSA